MIEGIILAGGYSSRAKNNKMAFELDGMPLILHTAKSMSPHVSRIVIVGGHHYEDIVRIFDGMDRCKVVYNPDYDKGMFSSVQKGMENTTGDVFIVPGDIPLIKPSTYTALKEAKGNVRVPSYKGKKGHPLFLAQSLRKPLLKRGKDDNLKAFRDSYPLTVVDTEDEGILLDVDTTSDYEKIRNDFERGTSV